MKILITGANGQVAFDLIQQLQKHNWDYVALDHQSLDITQTASIEHAFALYQADIVINTAAYTAVDKAEQETDLAWKINCHGAELLAQACAKYSAILIHLSTDYVFAGASQQAYREDDPAHPINVYGASKLAAEEKIREHLEKHIILRVSGVVGVHGHNFVKTMLKLGQERSTLRIVNDQYICPTPAEDIATAILTILSSIKNQTEKWGTYHYCSQAATNWFEFAEAIFKQAKAYQTFKLEQLEAIPSKEFPTPAKRPAFSVLNCEKIQSTFGVQQKPWTIGLNKIIKQLCEKKDIQND